MNEKMLALGTSRSVIRELFEYGMKRKREVGEENVFDFSLGNPATPPPTAVGESLIELLKSTDPVILHGYTSASGDASVRRALADNLNERFGTHYTEANFYLTVGAAAALCSTFGALLNTDDEVIVNAPYFPEYKVFIERAGGVMVSVPTVCGTFMPDVEAIRKKINERTRAVLINYPNNPTGKVITQQALTSLSQMLLDVQNEIGHPIYLISDEPYRELVYDGVAMPFVPDYYPNTVVCYSFSKSLSLPGERIGYVLVPSEAQESENLLYAVAGAGRALGYVCAPSLFQKLLPSVLSMTSDMSVYIRNRDVLYRELTKMGFEVVFPEGAFYLFVKSPVADAKAFSDVAKGLDLLLVPSDSFGTEGYVRIALCVSPAVVSRSLGAFRRLAEHYGLRKD